MNPKKTSKPLELDLSAVKNKLVQENGWSQEFVDELERQYRQFLELKVLNPHAELVPTRFIDEMWHAHILDTRGYESACQRIFGYFLHHYPYLGVGGPNEKNELNTAFDKTKQLWRATYAADYGWVPRDVVQNSGLDPVTRARLSEAAPGRCGADHSCHAPSACACRSPGACK